MRLSDIVNGPWAITPVMYEEIRNIYATHMRGEKIDIRAIEARIGRPLANTSEDFEVVNNVAIIPLHGVIAKRANLFFRISGGVSTEIVESQIKAALGDPGVTAIILDIDSPGGTVDGTFELVHFIRSAIQQKNILAFSNGTMASAAYAIGAATNRIMINTPGTTNQIGSIGVIATHEFTQVEGVTITEVVSGKMKNAGSFNAPLSEAGKESMQNTVDQIFTGFAADISEFRGIPIKTITDFEGAVFLGKEAIEKGLVDGVSTIDELIVDLGSGSSATVGLNSKKEKEVNNMITIETLKAENSDVYDAVFALGASMERQRIQAVQTQCLIFPGHEKLAEELMFDGKTTGEQAAVKVLSAESVKVKRVKQEIAEDAPKVVPTGEAPTEVAMIPEFANAEEEAAYKWENSAKIRKEYAGKKENHLAFVRNLKNIRIMGVK